jgi:uncharacterized Fe-S center protein
MSEVFFAQVGSSGGKGLLENLRALFKKAGFADCLSPKDLVAVKLHFGEHGCTSFIPSIYIREIVEEIKLNGGNPFLTDTGVLYLGKRRNAYDHVLTAFANGFGYASTGAPVIIADGLRGSDVLQIEIPGKYYRHVDVAGVIVQADSLVVLSHITGHNLTGFAGTFKNLGMGAVGRKVKLSIHELVRPEIEAGRCDACATCVRQCPAEALYIDRKNKSAAIDLSLCIGCGECVNVCENEAISIKWRGESGQAQEKLVEAASAVIKQKQGKICYFNFLLNVTPSCDCWERSLAPMVPDIGILASKDPVAIDQAAADMVKEAPPALDSTCADPARRFTPADGGPWDIQLRFAEMIGLGSRSYNLVEL